MLQSKLPRQIIAIYFYQYNKRIMPRLQFNGFYDQKRNLTFVKTDFQVLKFKFHACNF